MTYTKIINKQSVRKCDWKYVHICVFRGIQAHIYCCFGSRLRSTRQAGSPNRDRLEPPINVSRSSVETLASHCLPILNKHARIFSDAYLFCPEWQNSGKSTKHGPIDITPRFNRHFVKPFSELSSHIDWPSSAAAAAPASLLCYCSIICHFQMRCMHNRTI